MLDLIDYANAHDGQVSIDHLYEELKGVQKMDEEWFKKTEQEYLGAYRHAITVFAKEKKDETKS